jgi:2-iminobutanoate/2-iminopropanoate deaminase
VAGTGEEYDAYLASKMSKMHSIDIDIDLTYTRQIPKITKLHAFAPDAIGPYSQAMKVGNLVFTSGQIAIDPATGNVEATTIEEQTHQVCKNLTNVLEAAGTSIGKAVKTVCFLKNMSDFGAFNGVYGEYFTSKPARSCVAAKELPKDVLVEVEVIAEV